MTDITEWKGAETGRKQRQVKTTPIRKKSVKAPKMTKLKRGKMKTKTVGKK